MEEKYKVGLKIFIILISVSVVHTAGNIFGHLGIISDLFVVLGLIQVWNNVKTAKARADIMDKIDSLIDIGDISQFLTLKTEEIKYELTQSQKSKEYPFLLEDASTTDSQKEEETFNNGLGI